MTELVLEIFALNGSLLAAGDRLTQPLKLTSARWQILGAIGNHGPLTAAQIARVMGLKRQSVQRLVDVLHADGFLAFEPNPDHARAKLIRLAVPGQKAVDALDAIQAGWVNGLAEGMEAERIGVATAVLRETTARLGRSMSVDRAREAKSTGRGTGDR